VNHDDEFIAPQWMCDIWDEFRAAMAAPEWRDVPMPPMRWPRETSRRQRKARKPTLASVAKKASAAGIEVARYEVKPDGSVVVITGKGESTDASNPWLADLEGKTKQ